MGSRNTRQEEDVHLPLNDEKEITLLEDDINISLDGPYPQVSFSKSVRSLIDESNKQTVIVRMLGRPIGYKALSNENRKSLGVNK